MPYILNTSADNRQMLKAIGVSSLEELYTSIPSRIRLNGPLNLPEGCSELEVERILKNLARKNNPLENFNSFLGAGLYDHYIPAALPFILAGSSFLTAYTPYQAECSQGVLQAIYEYQSYLCLLTGMDVSNASLLDGASAFAEAVLMSLRITRRNKVILAGAIHPEYIETLNTYLSGMEVSIQSVSTGKDGFVKSGLLERTLDAEAACCVLQSPNFFGLVEDVQAAADLAAKKGVLTLMITNPLSLAIFKEPARLGVDIVCGDGQSLGGSLNCGGPSFGFLVAKNDYVRQIPGRIVGETVDKEGKAAYCLTLQAREQHIRREKATSNICSNQSLNAIAAGVYLSLMGQDGLKKAALYSFSNTQYLYQRLKTVRGVRIPYPARIFNEFIWEVDEAPKILDQLYRKKIIAGYFLGEKFPQYKSRILSCCTEKKSVKDIDDFVSSLAEILHG